MKISDRPMSAKQVFTVMIRSMKSSGFSYDFLVKKTIDSRMSWSYTMKNVLRMFSLKLHKETMTEDFKQVTGSC